ncbi:MAG TPA: hydroxyacylglutathione hydrolase [Gallionellaceae bacterium]|nr:hydroxyacylglutathione hydrolase [Gallionellaceae bacterium]
MYDITPIHAFEDNYIWALHNSRHAVVVDPGEAEPVLAWLKNGQFELAAILCTHHHGDHIGGIAKLLEVYNVPVYAPRAEDIAGTTQPLAEGDTVTLPELDATLQVLDIRGHTRGHLGYTAPGLVFCGDTLFGCGCGRVFEGTMEEMLNSLQRLAALPDDTRVYCAHEYTEANIRFALACEPENASLQARAVETRALRAADKATVPSTIALEKATNPFLRCREPAVIRGVQQACGISENGELAVFTAMRNWKNHFKA